MPTSVRLDRVTEAALERIARAAGRSKSWVVREAVAAYAATSPHARAPYELIAPFVGAGDTGLTGASERTGEAFAALLGKRPRAGRSR
ncbi:MAG: ribbon-helix-helix domain-containing protein [Vicinamibacterales bacterium]